MRGRRVAGHWSVGKLGETCSEGWVEAGRDAGPGPHRLPVPRARVSQIASTIQTVVSVDISTMKKEDATFTVPYELVSS